MKSKKNRKNIIIFFVLTIVLCVYISDRFQLFGEEKKQDEEKKENIVEEVIKEDKTQTINMIAAGDIIYHMTQINSAYDENTGTYDFKPFFQLVKPIIESADIAIANFEGTTGGNVEPYKAYPRFNIPDETIDAVNYAGFDILSTANNHSIDMYKEGIIRTLEQIHKRGILTVGTYKEKPETRVLMVEEKGIKIAFLSYTYGGNGMEATLSREELESMINIIDEQKIIEDINYSKNQGADLIVAFMHWWNDEYQREPEKRKRDLADLMFSGGVDIILGSHPHVIQESEIREYGGEKKFIIYSMGNFISNQRQETLDQEYPNLDNFYTEDGVIVDIQIKKDFDKNITEIENIKYIPTWVNRYKKETGKYHYDVIPIEKYLANNSLNLDEKTLKKMERSFRDTMKKMQEK